MAKKSRENRPFGLVENEVGLQSFTRHNQLILLVFSAIRIGNETNQNTTLNLSVFNDG